MRTMQLPIPGTSRFRGSFTALATPLHGDMLDESSFRRMIDWQIEEGTDGLVPGGVNGESATLDREEHRLSIDWCVNQARRRVPIIACKFACNNDPLRGGFRVQ